MLQTESKSKKTEYSMFEYIEGLHKAFGTNIAMFGFENFLVLQLAEPFYEKILRDDFASVDAQSGRKILHYVNQKRHTHLSFKIENSASDLSYFQSFKTLRNFTKYLNETVLGANVKYLTHRWRNPLVSLLNNRYGKSISNTDFVYSLNPHSATQVKGGTEKRFVPVEYGFVSHFRVEDIVTDVASTGDHYLDFSIHMLKVDIEYFLFLVANYKIFE
jgi:hypothetical protein